MLNHFKKLIKLAIYFRIDSVGFVKHQTVSLDFEILDLSQIYEDSSNSNQIFDACIFKYAGESSKVNNGINQYYTNITFLKNGVQEKDFKNMSKLYQKALRTKNCATSNVKLHNHMQISSTGMGQSAKFIKYTDGNEVNSTYPSILSYMHTRLNFPTTSVVNKVSNSVQNSKIKIAA